MKRGIQMVGGLLFIAALGLINPFNMQDADAHQGKVACSSTPGSMVLINDDGHDAVFHLPVGDVNVAHNQTSTVAHQTGTYTVDWSDSYHQATSQLPESCGKAETTTTTLAPPPGTVEPAPFDGYGNYCYYPADGTSQFGVAATGPGGFELHISQGPVVSDSDNDGYITWDGRVPTETPSAEGFLNGRRLGMLPHVGPSMGCPGGTSTPPTTGDTSSTLPPPTTAAPVDSGSTPSTPPPSIPSSTTPQVNPTSSTSPQQLPKTGFNPMILLGIGVFVLLAGLAGRAVARDASKDGGVNM